MPSASSSSTNKAQKESSTVSHPLTGATYVTSAMNSSPRVTSVPPIVPSSLEDPSLQPTALVFRSGIAFDYENFPKLASIWWPVIIDQSGTSVVVNDGPTRGISRGTAFNHEALGDRSFFTWDSHPNQAQDPVPRAPGVKASICASHNSCELQTEMTTKSGRNCVTNTHSGHLMPPLVQPCECPIHRQSMFKRPRLHHVEITGHVLLNSKSKNGHFDRDDDTTMLRILEHNRAPRTQPKHVSFCLPNGLPSSVAQEKDEYPVSGQVLISRDNQNPNSDQVTICNIDLVKRPTKTKPLHVSFCLPEDTKQSALEGDDIPCSVGKEKKLATGSSSVSYDQSNEQRPKSENTCCASDNISTEASRNNMLLRSKEVAQVYQDNTGGEATVEIPYQPLSSKKATDVIPIVVEDDDSETAVKNQDVASSEESYVFTSGPTQIASQNANPPSKGSAHSSTGSANLSTGSTGLNSESRNKLENVRDLIARIRYIKSRLHRAECEYRKKQMLKTILSLQKRVKALTKGMRKEKVDLTKDQELTNDASDHNAESIPRQELPEVNHRAASDSHAVETTDKESQAGHMIQDGAVLGNKEGGSTKRHVLLLRHTRKPTSESPKGRPIHQQRRQTLQECEKSAPSSVDTFTLHKNVGINTNELKATVPHSSNDGSNRETNRNNSRQERASFSLLNPDGILEDLVLTPPAEIGWDYSAVPCGKTSSSPSAVEEKEFQRNHNTTSKKMKRLSLSEREVTDAIDTVSSSFQAVTQIGTTEKLVADDNNDVNETNVSQNETSILPVKNEMDKNGCVMQDALSVIEDSDSGTAVPNGKIKEEKRTKTYKKNVLQKEKSSLPVNNETISTDRDVYQRNSIDAKQEITLAPCEGNEDKDNVTYDVSRHHSVYTTLETKLARKVGNEDTGNLKHRELQHNSACATQDTGLARNCGNEEVTALRNHGNNLPRQSGSDSSQNIFAVKLEKVAPLSPLLLNGMLLEVGAGEQGQTCQDIEKAKDCSAAVDEDNSMGSSKSPSYGENNNISEDVDMDENQPETTVDLSDHEPCAQEMEDNDLLSVTAVPLDDNENDQELFRLAMENVLEEERTERFTSLALHNPSKSEEDIDLMQSLQIRQARILNLTQKRDRLFSLVMGSK